MYKKRQLQQGFTLIELLIVIVIIAALSVSVFVALNPPQRIADANDARRRSDVDSILTAIHSYTADNQGSLPSPLATNMAQTQLGTNATGCDTPSGCGAATACADLSTPLATYLKSIPLDPKSGTAAKTRYSVAVDSNNIITVTACDTAGATTITSSR